MASISDILLDQGRRAGELRRQKANTWAPTIQQLANLPGQIMADRRAERASAAAADEAAFDRQQQRDVRQGQIDEGNRKAESDRATAEQQAHMRDVLATPGVIGEDGRFDTKTAQRIATEKGYRTVLSDVLTFGREWNEGVDKGLLTTEQIAAAKRSNQPQGYTLNPGDTRFAPGGAVEASVPAEVNPDTRALSIQLADAIRNGRMEDASAIRRAIREDAAAGRAPEKPEDPLVRRERELRIATLEAALKKANGGPATPEKLEAVAPVLDEIETLSKRIFTTDAGPVTNVIGAARRGAAALNLDNDVREYRSLVRGFTPLMARAVGHNGVLTEQDVQRTEMLFGDVGWLGTDNKTVAENKMSRLKTIMVGGGTDEEKAEIRRLMGWDTQPDGAAPRGRGAGPVGRVYYDENGNRVAR